MKTYIQFNDKSYYIDLARIKELVITAYNETSKEVVTIDSYEQDSRGNLTLTNKAHQETLTPSDSLNPASLLNFEFIKTLIERVINDGAEVLEDLSFGGALSFNTLLEYGIITEAND